MSWFVWTLWCQRKDGFGLSGLWWTHLGWLRWWGPLPLSFIPSQISLGLVTWYLLSAKQWRQMCTNIWNLHSIAPAPSIGQNKSQDHIQDVQKQIPSLWEELPSHIIRSFVQGREACTAIFAICCKSCKSEYSPGKHSQQNVDMFLHWSVLTLHLLETETQDGDVSQR